MAYELRLMLNVSLKNAKGARIKVRVSLRYNVLRQTSLRLLKCFYCPIIKISTCLAFLSY